ncbi:hypothetical protein [uncultured virus]|uniref:Uncharacterized protein n=1 Tax=uncultured virus TaxID=340016 RepID=A0A218MNB1_9VIRU|nr:hypothetical protein [uncultured virus]
MAKIKVKKENKEVNFKPSQGKSSHYTLMQGTGTPYIAFFNEDGQPLKNPDTGVPLGAYVTSFELKLSEEAEDYGTIKIDNSNPDLVNMSELNENGVIIIQYGYIFSNGLTKSSKPKKLVVKQVSLSFDESGTHISIMVKDSVTDLRHSIPFKPSGDDVTMLDYMDNGFGQDVGVIIEMFE